MLIKKYTDQLEGDSGAERRADNMSFTTFQEIGKARRAAELSHTPIKVTVNNGLAWKYSLNLNIYFTEYPLPVIRKLFEIMCKSDNAPKGFGICKMCLDYLLSVYDNEIEYKKERKKIASIFKYIEKYEAYYHLFTEGS